MEPVFRFEPTEFDENFADLLFFIGSQFGHLVGIMRIELWVIDREANTLIASGASSHAS